MDSNYNNNQNGGYGNNVNNNNNGYNNTDGSFNNSYNNTDGSFNNSYNNADGSFNNNGYQNGNAGDGYNNGNYNGGYNNAGNNNGGYNYNNGGYNYNNGGYNNGMMPQQDNRGSATAALVLGIISLVAWCLPLAGYPITIAGLIIGIGAMKNCTTSKGMAIAGVIMCSIGLVATLINSILGVILNLSAL